MDGWVYGTQALLKFATLMRRAPKPVPHRTCTSTLVFIPSSVLVFSALALTLPQTCLDWTLCHVHRSSTAQNVKNKQETPFELESMFSHALALLLPMVHNPGGNKKKAVEGGGGLVVAAS